MLSHHISRIINEKPEYAGLSAVIEKEILHHDLMHILVEQGVLQKLTFIGGTALRLCYNSARLSEDLDFNAGHEFRPAQLNGLEIEIQRYLSRKYEVEVFVNKPSEQKQGDTASWKISIEKQAKRPDIPRQKLHIDVCAIPSFDVIKQPLINHYGINTTTEGYLIPVQSLSEIFIDKFIALAYRSRRIKPRDLWDIVWLYQQNTNIDVTLMQQKLAARSKPFSEFKALLTAQINKLKSDDAVKTDFYSEMSRFIPQRLKKRTLDNPDYWPYLESELTVLASKLTNNDALGSKPFDMS